MTRLSWVFLFCYIFFGAALSLTPEEIIKKAEKGFLTAKTMEAGFGLRIDWKLKDTVEEKNGKIFIQNPDKYRVELEDGLFISNGETFYRYSGKAGQLVINNVRDIGIAGNEPGSWLFRYSDRYTPLSMDSAVVSDEKCFGITLKPKKDENRFKALKVWINPESGQVRKIETTDRNENIATYLITRLVRNAEIKPSLFTFQPPKGTEVIDMRE